MRLSSDTCIEKNEQKQANWETQEAGTILRRGGREDRKDRGGTGKEREEEHARMSFRTKF